MIKNKKIISSIVLLMILSIFNVSFSLAEEVEEGSVPPTSGNHEVDVYGSFIGAGYPMYDMSIEVEGENEFDAKNQTQTKAAQIKIINNSTHKVNFQIQDIAITSDWQPNLVEPTTNFINMSPENAEKNVYFGINTPACNGITIPVIHYDPNTSNTVLTYVYKVGNKMRRCSTKSSKQYYTDGVHTIGINPGITYSNITTSMKGAKNLIEDKEIKFTLKIAGSLVW